jgi:acyl-CoA oxidase
MMLQMERDPLFRMDNVHDLTRPEVRERVMKRLKSVAHWLGTEAQEDFTSRLCVMILVDPGFMTRLAVHVLRMLSMQFLIDRLVWAVLQHHCKPRNS